MISCKDLKEEFAVNPFDDIVVKAVKDHKSFTYELVEGSEKERVKKIMNDTPESNSEYKEEESVNKAIF